MTRAHVDTAGNRSVRGRARVDLKREDAKELRAQTNRLRDRMEEILKENPDFELRKTLLSGSSGQGHVAQDHQRHRCGLLRVLATPRRTKSAS